MKDPDFTTAFALTLDQRDSRRRDDRVPELLDHLTRALDGQVLLPPERTAGDEVQLLLDDPAAVVETVEAATRLGGWWVGVGVGSVELPLPHSTRAARGPAYLAARRAVERAQRTPTGLAVEIGVPGARPGGGGTVGARPYGGAMSPTTTTPIARAGDSPEPARQALESALWLQQSLLRQRSPQGWEVVDLLDEGLTVAQAAARLGISASAVTQRHQRAGHELARHGRQLCTGLAERLLGVTAALDQEAAG